MITSFMNLNLPTVTVTLGPEWATELNQALETVDSHDHSSGKGKKVPVAGIDINASLNFVNNKAFNLLSSQFQIQSVVLSGASNAASVYSVNGDLYYTNGSGTAIQLTSGGSPITVPAAAQSFERVAVNGDLTIDPSDTFVELSVDTTASRTITMPLAASVIDGRIYMVKDATGNANVNPITIAVQGSDDIDGAVSYTMDSASGSIMLISNGVDAYEIV
jgi:hypothetical protein